MIDCVLRDGTKLSVLKGKDMITGCTRYCMFITEGTGKLSTTWFRCDTQPSSEWIMERVK